MKPSSIFILLCSTLALAAKSLDSVDGSQSRLVKASTDVPGDNPLVFCSDPADYIFDIDYVNLKPNPPIPGQSLRVEAFGTLTKDIESGTKLFLKIDYNSIPLLEQEVDLCDQFPRVGFSCPVKKGPLNITRTVEITSMVPKGKYVVTADIFTEGHKEEIVCLEGTAVVAYAAA